ncbi:MAG: hypothetical protein RIS17_764, partial [Pseudomonadota bacterium]
VWAFEMPADPAFEPDEGAVPA